MKRSDIENKILSIGKLPTLPDSVERIIKLIDSPRGVSISTLSKIISNDPAITARILKVANSPYYGYRKEISTVGRAIMIIGLNETKNIILTSTILKLFPIKEDNFFNIYEFWKHCIGVAVVAKLLSKKFHYAVSGEAFITGLLHEIGILILYEYFTPYFFEILKKFRERKTDLEGIEEEVLGVTHYEVGAFLAEKWNMPSNIVSVIKYYNTPELANNNKELVAIVNLSKYIVLTLKVGSTIDNTPKLNSNIWEIFSHSLIAINEVDLPQLITLAKEELDRADDLFGILR